jgi:hypothetical protein
MFLLIQSYKLCGRGYQGNPETPKRNTCGKMGPRMGREPPDMPKTAAQTQDAYDLMRGGTLLSEEGKDHL